MRSGHIPGSRSLPITTLVVPATKTMLPADGLRRAFDAAGVDPARPIISSCGSGVTACVIALAAQRLGHSGVAVYDGSWRSEEHTSELQSLMSNSYAVFCLQKKKK